MLFIFDMGGVLTSTFKIDSLYNEIGISEKQFFEICNQKKDKFGDDIWDLFQKGKIESLEFWNQFNKISKKMKIKPVLNDLFRLYFHPILKEDTLRLINALKVKNRVVCGTNTCQSHWENHLERGDYSYFHQTYASNKIGEIKPNPNFWKLIMKAEGFSPENTFFTDDKIQNVQAARSLGINAEIFTCAEDLYKLWEKYI